MKTRIFYILFAITLFQSCISIKESTLRDNNPKVIEGEKYKISSTGEVYLNLFGLIKSDFLPASIRLEFDTTTIFIDPVVVNDTNIADFIFITHNHLDHFSVSDIKKLSNYKTVVVGPKTVTKKIKDNISKTASIGDTIDFGNVKCEVVESYNINSNIHKRGDKFLGYVISYEDVRVYLAGDTDFIPEMEELDNITVAIIPIGEGKTAMNPEAAADAANLINPDIVIPCHYEIGNNSETDFGKLVNENIKVRFLR